MTWLRVIFASLVCINIQAQDTLRFYRPASLLKLEFEQQTIENWQKIYKGKRVSFSETELGQVKQDILKSNQLVELELDRILQSRAELYIKKLKVLANKDNDGLLQEVVKGESSKKAAREELSASLSQVKFPGVFVVLLENIDRIGDEVKTWHKAARSTLEPKAINNIIGTQIERLTKIESFKIVKDVIKTFSGGELDNGYLLFDRADYQKEYFLYMVKVNVRPLAKAPPARSDYPRFPGRVFDTVRDTGYLDTLAKLGVLDKDLIEISRLARENSIRVDTEVAEYLQDAIVKSGNSRIAEINKNIFELREKIKERSKNLESLCEELETKFNPDNLEATGDNLINLIDYKLSLLEVKWKETKEKELITKEQEIDIYSNAPQSFAGGVSNLLEQIKENYSSVHRPFESMIIENNIIKEYKEGRVSELFRNINSTWCYPVFMSEGIRLLVVSSFNISQKPHSIVGENIPQLVYIPKGAYKFGNLGGLGGEGSEATDVDGFWMGKFEVTQAEWEAVMGFNPSQNRNCPNCPIENVNWFDIQEFLKKLNHMTGLQFKLPTESQWEYAAREQGTNLLFGDGQNTADPDRINFRNDKIKKVKTTNSESDLSSAATIPVGSLKAPNALGLHDMSGNVFEWCWNQFNSTQKNNLLNSHDNSGRKQVVRGGSWYTRSDLATTIFRQEIELSEKLPYVGFRVVLQ